MKQYHPFISDNTSMIHNGHQSSSFPILQQFIPQLYTNLIEMVHDAVIVCDLKQHILLWNKSAEQLYKWGQQEVQGQIYHELLQSELLVASEKNILTLSKQDYWEGDLQQVCHDGTNVIVKSRQTIIRNPDDQYKIILITNQNITEQTRIDQELKKQLHLISIAGEIGFWSWDINNDQLTTFLNTPNNAKSNVYTYAQYLQLIDAEDRERIDTIIQDALKTGAGYNFEYRCITEPAHVARWINVLGRVIYNEQGQPAYSVGVSTDITDQKNLEAALKETNHHLQVVLETMRSDSLCFLDNHWRFTYISRKAEEIFQRSQKSLLGKNLWEEMPCLRGTQFERKLIEAVETQTTIQFDHVNSIDKHWYEVRLYTCAEGTLIYWHDITEYRSTKNALQASEAKVASLLETNIIGMCISDSTGKVYTANDTYLSMLGFTQTDLAEGKINWIEQTPPEYREYDQKCVHDISNHGTCKPYEKEICNKQGQIVPILVVGRIIDTDNEMYTALIIDVTAQKQLEKQKETFMSIIGHELRTPLTAINGSIQLVQRRLKRIMQERPENFEPETQAMFEKLNKLLEQSLRQTRVQNRLINDLLDISRLAIDKLELTLQPQDLIHLVREIVKDLRYTAGNRTINLKLPEQQTILVQADSDRIGQVLSNYITNALKYTDPSEPVTVEVTLSINEARVWVHDKGAGLSEEDQKRIWESYYRTSNANDRQGTGINLGLGLHICQILIQRHEGQVGVVSKEKEGSSFWFSLPTTCVRIE